VAIKTILSGRSGVVHPRALHRRHSGARHKIRTINRILLERGHDQRALDRITSPVGLNIGGETPEEIAISIAAGDGWPCAPGKIELFKPKPC